MVSNNTLTAALNLAGKGKPVFPCHSKDKKPLIKGGFTAATTNPDQLREWWAKWPGAMIGLPTGKESGFFVLDVDRPKKDGEPDGLNSITELQKQHGSLEGFTRQRTPSGGVHYLFKWPADIIIKNSARKIAPGLDIRGAGGYIVIAPSYSTQYNAAYEWECKTPLADAPQWILDLIQAAYEPKQRVPTSPPARKTPVEKNSPYALATLENEIKELALCCSGGRNTALNAAAFNLGALVAAGALSREQVESELYGACQQNGLIGDDGEQSFYKTLRSGIEKGMAHPREIPEATNIPVAYSDGTKGNETSVSADREPLPTGYEIRIMGKQSGLWHVEYKVDGDPIETWIGAPLYVLGKTRDTDGNSWGLLLEWNDPEGRRHTWAMPKSLLVGKDTTAWLGRLVDEGWAGAPSTKARNLLALYLAMYETKHLVRCVDRTGWHEGVFVLPDTVKKSSPTTKSLSDVSDGSDEPHSHNDLKASDKQNTMSDASDGERIVLQVRTAHNPFRVGGTLEGWQSTIGTLARGNSRVMLPVCASLASLLLEMSGQESGGFNFIGGSSTGKTTALVAAGSVWGKGSSSGGYIQNWRATDNGLEGIAALHSDAVLCLDEIGQAPGRTIKEASYMLSNGMGKVRASADGSARTVKTWRIMILSTGEKGLADKIVEEGGKVQAGQLVRLVDIPADAGAGFGAFESLHGYESPQAFSEAIKQAAATHYGHAARAFIAAYLNSAEAKTEIPLFMAQGLELICPKDATSQVQRVAKRFLLCAAAGEAAVKWGILPWKKKEALAAVKVCFEAWLALRGGVGATEDNAILEQVHLFIEQHGTSRFQDIDNPAHICINRVGFRRKIQNDIEFMILPECFKAEVCKGLNAKRAATLLLEHGLLIPGEGRNLMRRSPCELPGFGRKRCYTILLKDEVQHAAG